MPVITRNTADGSDNAVPARSAPARGRRGLALVLTAALGGLFALLLAAPALATASPAYPPGTGCTVSTATVDAGPGDTVTVVGSGFAAHQTVTLSIPAASAALGTVTTDGKGSFSGTFTWPASVTGKSAVVRADAPSTTCSFTLLNGKNVDARSAHRSNGDASTNSASGSSGGLSSTGFAVVTATALAVVLLGTGALFLGLARRTRS